MYKKNGYWALYVWTSIFVNYFNCVLILHVFLLLDNTVTAPGVDVKKAMTVSTNDQFQYETEEKLEDQLQLEYGTVSFCS